MNITEKYNPYGDIKKMDLTANGVKSSAYSIHLETPLEDKPWKEVGVVGGDYLLVKNADAVSMLHDITDNSDMNWNEHRTFFNGRQFMYAMTTNDVTKEVAEGDFVGLGIAVWNSYDGSRRLQYEMFVNRLLCLNGMMSKKYFFNRKFKHDNTSSDWENDLIDITSVVNKSPERLETFANTCKKLLNPLRTQDLSVLRTDYVSQLPVTRFGNIMDEFLTDEEYINQTGWDFLNASTETLWHNKKPTVADYNNNQYMVDGILSFSQDWIVNDYDLINEA